MLNNNLTPQPNTCEQLAAQAEGVAGDVRGQRLEGDPEGVRVARRALCKLHERRRGADRVRRLVDAARGVVAPGVQIDEAAGVQVVARDPLVPLGREERGAWWAPEPVWKSTSVSGAQFFTKSFHCDDTVVLAPSSG